MALNHNAEEFSYSRHIKLIKKGKLLIFFCTFILVTLAVIYSLKTRPIYQATTKILIERKSPDVTGVKEIISLDAEHLDFYNTQYQILRSRSLAKSVIQKLKLENSEELNEQAPLIDLAPLKKWIKALPIFPERQNISEKMDQNPDPYSKWVNSFLQKLQVSPILQTRVVKITFEGYSPSLVTSVANSVADNYILETIKLKNTVGSGAKDWLIKRLEEIRGKVKKSEQELEKFIGKNSKPDVKKNLISDQQRIAVLNSQLIQAETEFLRLENLKKQIRKLKNDPIELIQSIPDSAKTKMVTQLTKEHLKLQQEYQDRLNFLGANHPEIIRAREKIKNIEERILKETNLFSKSIEIDTQAIESKKRFLKSALDKEKEKIREKIIKTDLEVIKYENLKQDLEGYQKFEAMLSGKLKEALLTLKDDAINIRIMDPAEIPKGFVRPRIFLNMAIAFIVGIFGGGFLVLVKDKFDDKIFTVEDVENKFPFPLMGTVASFSKRDDLSYEINRSNFQRLEEFGVLSAQCLQLLTDSGRPVIMVTSTGPNEGKTTLVENLAVALAGMDKKVLVIDIDLRKTKQEFILGVSEPLGWTDLIYEKGSTVVEEKGTTAVDCVHRTDIEGVWVLPKGNKIPKYPAMVFNSAAYKYLLKSFAKSYDFIILDGPPTLGLSDSLIISPCCDAVIFVVKSGEYNFKKINMALEQLSGKFRRRENGNRSFTGEEKIRMVLNMTNFQDESNYKNFGKYYSEYYGFGSNNGFGTPAEMNEKMKFDNNSK